MRVMGNAKHVLVVLVFGVKPGLQLNLVNPFDFADILSLACFR